MDTNINRIEDIKYLKQYLMDIKRNCNGKDDYLLFQNCLSEYACLMQSSHTLKVNTHAYHFAKHLPLWVNFKLTKQKTNIVLG